MKEVKMMELNLQVFREMQAWCKEKFGPPAWWAKQLENDRAAFRWHSQGMAPADHWKENENEGSAVFKFKTEQDATMFSLRWIGDKFRT